MEKKLKIGLALIITGYTTSSFAALPTGNNSQYNISIPSFCGGFTFGIIGLYWKSTSPHSDYAITFPNIDPLGMPILDNGTRHSVSSDYDWAFKVNLGYIFPCTANDIDVIYTYVDQDDHHEVKNQAATFPSLTHFFNTHRIHGIPSISVFVPLPNITVTTPLGASVVVPGMNFTTSSKIAGNLEGIINVEQIERTRAIADFQYHAWDVEIAQSMNIGCNLRIKWFGGLRYANLENTFDATYELSSITPNSANATITIAALPIATVNLTINFDVTSVLRDIINQKSEFNGFGPRFGVDVSYYLGCGFGLVGSLSSSLLVGEADSTLNERVITDAIANIILPIQATHVSSSSSVPVLGTTASPSSISASEIITTSNFKHPNTTRVVPNIDGKLGINYTYLFGDPKSTRISLEAGYMASYYFNSIDRLSLLGASEPEVRTRNTLDTNFEGPYIALQVTL